MMEHDRRGDGIGTGIAIAGNGTMRPPRRCRGGFTVNPTLGDPHGGPGPAATDPVNNMANEHVCSLCGRSSPTAVCAWCGMISDVGAAIEEARVEAAREAPGVRASTVKARHPAQAHPAHAWSAVRQAREEQRAGRSDSTATEREHPVFQICDGFEPCPAKLLEPPPGMCTVPAGIFQFGEARQPRYLPDYFIDTYPVTNQEYAEFVEETKYRLPRFWGGGQPPAGKADHPVVGVNHEDAAAYARWVGKQLPTEEEWEKAARGSDGRTYPWGEMFVPSKANVSGSGIKDTSSVRRFPQGVSPWGCHDVAGNVWEWTASPYQSGGVNCALKGGSWYDFSTHSRCISRFSAPPDYEGNSVGFRCVVRPGDPGDRPVRPRRLPAGPDYDRDRFRTAVCSSSRSAPFLARASTLSPGTHPGTHPGKPPGPLSAQDPGSCPAGTGAIPRTDVGPLRDLVDTAVDVLDQFDPLAVQARMDEILEDETPAAGVKPAAMRPPEVTPEHELPLPEGRCWRWLRPAARGLWTLLPWGDRVARGLDVFFKRTPRWITFLVILVIPLASGGLILYSTAMQKTDRVGLEGRGRESWSATNRASANQRRGSAQRRGRSPGRGARPAGAHAPALDSSRVEPPVSLPEASAGSGANPPATRICTAPPGMVRVPGGECVVGRERRQLRLPGFFMDRHEVTNLAYHKFVIQAGYPAPPHWKQGAIPAGLENHPVVNVDHADARAYARWAGKRLPTEEEWEKAARGAEGRIYPWGDEPDNTRANLFHPAAQGLGTRAVGSTAQGVSPYGCHDMAGNVLEWTDSRMGENFVLKGGSWGLSREGGACHFRYVFFPPETRTPMVGFRCVKDMPAGAE